jgi:dihydroneopterin aldolase
MDGEERGDDADELDDEGRHLDEDREEAAESVTIEISGLSLYTHHGVSEAEREVGQRLVLDLRLDVGETDATVTDSIEDTVDYAEVCQLVAVKAAKPEPPIALSVDEVSVEVWREAEG